MAVGKHHPVLEEPGIHNGLAEEDWPWAESHPRWSAGHSLIVLATSSLAIWAAILLALLS